ncbi:hypothetical protein HOP51_20035, partial [Halomonas sp. MCCC 1A11036]|nr:hypothetical protein [Halomonas zhangzhouensis]
MGGAGGENGPNTIGPSGDDGPDGAGGYGVQALGNSTIVNAGRIEGGLGRDGYAEAVHLSGGGNTLVLADGYEFIGNVVSVSGTAGGGDTLQLGGSIDNDFDLADVEPTSGTFRGFNVLAVDGDATWTVWGDGSSFTGTTRVSVGTLRVGNGSGPTRLGGGLDVQDGGTLVLTDGDELHSGGGLNIGMSGSAGGTLRIENGGSVLTDGESYIGSEGTVTVTGNGSEWENTGILGVGAVDEHGELMIEEGGRVSAGTGMIGFAGTGANVTVSGAGSRLELSNSEPGFFDVDLIIGYGILGITSSGALTVTDGGHVDLDNGTGSAILGFAANSEGILNIGAAEGAAAGAAGTFGARTLQFGEGTGRLVFNHTNESGHAFATGMESTGDGGNDFIEHLAGTTLLTGDGLTIATVPDLSEPAAYQVQAGGGNVDLFIAAPGDDTLQHWQGGNGTWDGTNAQWLNDGGPIPVAWAGNHAVFKNEPGGFSGGTITLEGDRDFKGLQFVDDGYAIVGDGRLVVDGSDRTDGNAEIRVLADSTEIAATISGTGGIAKTEAGTLILSGSNDYEGGTFILGGTVQVSSDANLGATQGGITLNGGTLATTQSFDSDRTIAMPGAAGFDVAAGTRLGLTGDLTGAGDLVMQGGGTLVLTGTNAYGDTSVRSGTLMGNTGSLSGDIAVADAGTVIFDQETDADFAGNIAGLNSTQGNMILRGGGALTLDGASTLDWTIEDGTLETAAARFTGDARLDGAGSALVFDDGANAHYAGTLSGDGRFVFDGGGSVQLSGDSSAFTGTTAVSGGTLQLGDGSGTAGLGGDLDVVDGGTFVVGDEFGGDVTARTGGTLTGSGTVAGSVDLAGGGVLSGAQGQSLEIDGNLIMDESSVLDVTLGGAPADALFEVGDDLTLDGTLEVTDRGGFGMGVYRLFDYGGDLTDNGLAIGATPAGVGAGDLFVQTAVANQVNLISTVGAVLRFWDGEDTALHDNDAIDGGSGTWRADGRNWTDEHGALNGSYRPSPTFAVFQGRAGTVRVDDSAGAIAVTGMQFASDGYRIEGDAIALEGTGGQSIIRVGDGTAASAGMTATIASELTGDTRLVMSDPGTLVLEGDNRHTGGTELREGTLSVSSDANLGDAAGALVFTGGTLATTASFDTDRAVVLDVSGRIDVAAGTRLGLTGDIAGTGNIAMQGGGTLTLGGTSSLFWTVEDGTLISDTDHFLGNLHVEDRASFIFDQAHEGTWRGRLSGTGGLAFTGGGAVELTGDSAGFTGLTEVTGATLVVNDTLGGSATIGMGGFLGGAG